MKLCRLVSKPRCNTTKNRSRNRRLCQKAADESRREIPQSQEAPGGAGGATSQFWLKTHKIPILEVTDTDIPCRSFAGFCLVGVLVFNSSGLTRRIEDTGEGRILLLSSFSCCYLLPPNVLKSYLEFTHIYIETM